MYIEHTWSGVRMLIHGKELVVRGTVLISAAHSFGGFKAGVGFALHKCQAK